MATATATRRTAPDIGIGREQRERVAQALARVLADTYTLYLQTHNFHWNVTGPQCKLTGIAEAEGEPAADEMIALLAKNNEAVSRSAREALAAAQAADDEASADILIQRMQQHEKNAWMLRSLLER